MGLLSSVNNSSFKRNGVNSAAFLSGSNITGLKEKATEIISGKPEGFINEKNWGSIGSFYFTTYKLPVGIQFSESDEYIEYSTMAQFKEREFKRANNRSFSFSFTMKQRDIYSETQTEEGLFEEDMLRTLDALYGEKNKRIPLDLFFYSGQLYLGQYSIDSIDTAIIELDSNGYPDSVEVSLELTKYPDSQWTGTSFLTQKQYFKLANI
jgi:hypothetical protein